MTLIRFDPFNLQRRLWRPFFDDETWTEPIITEGLNVYEEDDNVIVEAAVPGIPEDKLEVTYEDGVLHITGQHREKEEEKKKNRVVHRMERVSSFNYTTYLPRPINDKKIQAEVKDGVLTVKAPIAEQAKPKRVLVKPKSK